MSVHYNHKTGLYYDDPDISAEAWKDIDAIGADADPPSYHSNPKMTCAECGGELDDEAVKCKRDCGASYCSACRYKMDHGMCIECADAAEAKGGGVY